MNGREEFSSTRTLVTGCAGFIGYHVAMAILERGGYVQGIDDLCEEYYSRDLKLARLARLEKQAGFRFFEADLAAGIPAAVETARVDSIIHLAAHAAVMYSFEKPHETIRSNIGATQALFDWAAGCPNLEHVVYASSSSVYGVSEPGELSREDRLPRPISPYGMSKVANEAQAQTFFHATGIPVTGLRFFKVYGPWARPDTVFFKFTDQIHRGEPVEIYNEGRIQHSFTSIHDVVVGLLAALERPRDSESKRHSIYNLGNDQSLPLVYALELIERHLGRRAERRYLPLRRGDRSYSHADVRKARRELGFTNETSLEAGLEEFVSWYRTSYTALVAEWAHASSVSDHASPGDSKA